LTGTATNTRKYSHSLTMRESETRALKIGIVAIDISNMVCKLGSHIMVKYNERP